MKRDRILQYFGAASGLVAAVLMFSAGIINDIEVDAVSSSSAIAAAIIDSQQEVIFGTYLLVLRVFFFFGYLRGEASGQRVEAHWLSRTVFGAGLVGCAMLLLSAHFGQSLTILSSYGNETQVAKSLYLLDWNWYLLVEAIPIAVFIGANSINGLFNDVWPR